VASPPPVDVDKLLGAGAKVNISSVEDPADRAHRHRTEWALTRFGMGVVALVLLVSAGLVTWHSDPDVRKVGAGLLTAILGGVLGFMAGRGSK
jgi:hypothetical protein